MPSYTPILALPEIAPTQGNKSVTHNDALVAIEQATQAQFLDSTAGAAVTLSDSEATRNMLYQVSGGSANFDVTFPATVNALPLYRLFVAKNADTTYTARFITSAAGTSVTLQPGAKALLQQNGNDIVLIGYFNDASAGPVPYDIGVFIPGLTTASQLCLQFTAPRAFRFPDNFSGSDANTGTNPTASAVFTILKNAVSIGTLTFNTSGVPTFATSGSGYETFAAGDILTITSQVTPDATMANISISLKGERT